MAEAIDLPTRIAAESAALPLDKQSAVLDFVLFIKARSVPSDGREGDAAWDQILDRPAAYPKLAVFLHDAAQEGEAPLDLSRL